MYDHHTIVAGKAAAATSLVCLNSCNLCASYIYPLSDFAALCLQLKNGRGCMQRNRSPALDLERPEGISKASAEQCSFVLY